MGKGFIAGRCHLFIMVLAFSLVVFPIFHAEATIYPLSGGKFLHGNIDNGSTGFSNGASNKTKDRNPLNRRMGSWFDSQPVESPAVPGAVVTLRAAGKNLTVDVQVGEKPGILEYIENSENFGNAGIGAAGIEQLIVRGNSAYETGDFQGAVDYWERAMESWRSLEYGGAEEMLGAALNLVRVYGKSGAHGRAQAIFEEVRESLGQTKNRTLKALFLGEAGDLHLAVGERDTAVRLLEKGLAEARLSGSRGLIANLLNNLGNAYAASGDHDRAAERFVEGLELSGGVDTLPGESALLIPTIRVNLAGARYLGKDMEGAFQQIAHAAEEIGRLPDTLETSRLLLSVAAFFKRIDSPHAGEARRLMPVFWGALDRAERIGKKHGDLRVVSTALGYKGNLYEREARYAEALSLTRGAVFHAQEGGLSDILYLWQRQLGTIFRRLGKMDAALGAYENAVATLTPVRRSLLRGRRRGEAFFNTRIRPVHEGLARLLIEASDRAAHENEREELLIRARDTMEMLKTYELEDFFRDECVTEDISGRVTLDRAYAETAILSPLILEDTLYLLLTLPSGMKKYRVELKEGGDLLALSVKRFRERLQDPSGSRYLYHAKRLYRLLIAPVEGELRADGVKTLLLSPDSVFRMIPFAALHDGERFLVEKYALGTIPGVTLMKPAPFSLKGAEVLLAGLSGTKGTYNALPFVSEELAGIENITGGRIILDREFTLDNLTDAFRRTDFSVVHMATHGYFGGKSGETWLRTHDEKLTLDRLDRLLSLGRFRKRPVELLTLSACRTALGDERAALGLGGIALKAGARSAVATLWYISDRAAVTTMTEFYRQLSSGQSKAKALRNAQMKLLRDKALDHPAFWAPFLLIGNWM